MRGILLDRTTGDLQINVRRDAQGKIVSGLVIGESDYQNVNLIIQAQKGEFKEVPTLGFGIDNYLKSPESTKQQFSNDLEKELKSVGYADAKVIMGETLLQFNVELNKL